MRRLLPVTLTLLLASAVSAADADADAIARGKAVYAAQRCAGCHSIAGEGGRRSALDGVGARLDAEAIRKWIVAPREMDPKVRKRAYDKLSPDDLAALVAYMQSLR